MSFPPTFLPGYHDEGSVIFTNPAENFRKLGQTDMVVSKIALGNGSWFGCSTMSGTVYGPMDEDESTKTIQHAIKMGINFVDTAYWYGQGVSEERLGKALKSVPRSAYYLATKIGRYELDPSKMFDFSAERTLHQVDEALKRLQVDYVDLIQVHDFEFANDESVILNETLPALEKVVKEGKARYIGITSYCLKSLKSIVEKSRVKIDTVLSYSRLTLFDKELEDYTNFFKKNNVGVINASVTGVGLLTPGGPMSWHIASEELRKLVDEARALCKENGINIANLAVHYGANQACVDTTLISALNLDILKDNVNVVFGNLSDKESEVLDKLLKIFGERRWHWEGVEGEKIREKLKNRSTNLLN